MGKALSIVEAECDALQHEAMQESHHHPGAAIGVEIGRHRPGGLAAPEHLGHALANLLESVGGAAAEIIVPEQFTPALDGAPQELVGGDGLSGRIDGQVIGDGVDRRGDQIGDAGASGRSTSRVTGSKITRNASPAIWRMISSLLAK